MDDFKEKYKDLFQFHEELRGILESTLDNHPEPTSPKQGFLLHALAKSHKTQAAILTLCEKGFGQDAGILSRSMFELAITSLFVIKDKTNKTAERFFEYDWIMRANMYKTVSGKTKFNNKLKKKDPDKTTIAEVMREAKRVKKKYPGIKNFRWSEETFRKMAKAVGRLDTYETAYHLQCNLTHPNPRNTNDYFVESNGTLEVSAGSDDKWISESLVASFDFFFHTISAWNDEFGFGLEKNLDDLAKRYSKKVSQISRQ
jgi:hypothetical protein